MCMPSQIATAAFAGLRPFLAREAEGRAARDARRLAEANAGAARARAGLAASAEAGATARALAGLRARAAESGLDPGYGSPLEVGLDRARAGAEAALGLVDEGRRQAAPADAAARAARRRARPGPSFALNLLTQAADWSQG